MNINGMLFIYLWCILTICYEITANDKSLRKKHGTITRRKFQNPQPVVRPAFRQQQRNKKNIVTTFPSRQNAAPRSKNAPSPRVRTTQGKSIGGRRTTTSVREITIGTFPFTTPNIFDADGLNYRRYTPKPKSSKNIISNAFRLNDTFIVRPPTRTRTTKSRRRTSTTLSTPTNPNPMGLSSKVPDMTPMNSNISTLNRDAETLVNSPPPKMINMNGPPKTVEGAMPSTPTHIKIEDSGDNVNKSNSSDPNKNKGDPLRTTQKTEPAVTSSSNKEDELSDEEKKAEEDERRSQENINKFQENLRKAVALNNEQDVPMEMFRCLPNEKGDCDSDSHFRNVSEKLLTNPDTLRADLEQFKKISARLKEVNLTWPDDFVFDKQSFQAKLDEIENVSKQVDRNKTDEIKVVNQYKLVQDAFKPVQTATRKPGQIFATDVVREIVKIKNLFIKRKTLDLLFYVLLNPGYKGDEDNEDEE